MKTRMILAGALVGLTVVGVWFNKSHAAGPARAERRILYYVDAMHPAYHSAKPGIAPDCGMPLTPVYIDELNESALSSVHSDAVHVSATVRQLYGVRLADVQESSGMGTLRVYGRVAADDTRVFNVDMGTEGYVKETRNDAVGDHVSKDQHLAVIYSPDFLAVAGGYLSANERSPGGSNNPAPATQNAASAQARADRLRNLGMSDAQIEEISSTRKLPEDVYVVSPTDGFILARNISSGMRFERHTELYRVADLSHIWILPEVFGKDAAAFRPGATARITLPDTGETLTARVSNVLPALDSATHTLQPRLEASNPGFHLRPGMFVDIDLHTPLSQGLTVPRDAVMDTGLAKHVFVEVSEGTYEARDVETGWSFNDRIEILSGLHKGERVIASGTFLIDSESRLHSGSADASSRSLTMNQ